MPTLSIKGLPDDLYRRLKRQAEANHRSLNGEIIDCLDRSVAPQPIDIEAWLAEAAALRKRIQLKPMTRRQLDAAKRSGRP
jgi:plasmid stability protein